MTKINPIYSFEFNRVLNPKLTEIEQIQNFASIISDKDRFESILPILNKKKEIIEKFSGFTLNENYDVYIVRCEIFNSFSLPITVDYSIDHYEILIFTLKEILKQSIQIRFPNELIREQYINAFIEFTFKNDEKMLNSLSTIHKASKNIEQQYEKISIDFESKTLKEYIEELYNN